MTFRKLCTALALGFGASAPNAADIEIEVTNMTHGIYFTPLLVTSHDGASHLFQVGTAASAAVQAMAEDGAIDDLVAAQDAAGADATATGRGLILPGSSETFSIFVTAGSGSTISLATMPVNTNDAFIGVRGAPVGGLTVGSSWTTYAPIYDAGTEANSAAAGNIPGPEDGSEGYNTARDDTDRVTRHPGVWIGDALSEAARFDGPVARVTVTRAQ